MMMMNNDDENKSPGIDKVKKNIKPKHKVPKNSREKRKIKVFKNL